jgi:hypothetical protein
MQEAVELSEASLRVIHSRLTFHFLLFFFWTIRELGLL